MLPRYKMSKLPAFMAGQMEVTPQMLEDYAIKTMAKLPKKYQRGSFGLDIMPFRQKDGSIGFKIIELNPSSTSGVFQGKHVPGGGSGFTDTSIVPYAGHAQYRQYTGRHNTPVALAGGMGAASLAGLGTALTTERPR
jgi:hypothetical protein